MELYSEDKEYEEHRRRHAERIARMREEKLRQQRMQKLIKKIAPLAMGVLALFIVVGIVIGNGGDKNSGQNDTQQTASTDNQATQTEDLGVTEQLETETEEKVVYEFKETANTVGIYSDKLISSHVVLINDSTNTIVASKGAFERISPASMTKVLTVLVAAEHITEGELEDPFTITLEITDYAFVNDCSVVGFLDEETVTVRDLFYGTILPSGADAAMGLATYIAGSHEAFVEMMNEKLEELGLADTAHFTNSVGLYDKEHYCTLNDMAIIMKAAMENELCREVLTTRVYTTVPTVQHPEGLTISNWFIRRIEDRDTGGKVIGAKTGYVDESRACAVSYGIFDETPYICVTLGANNSWRCIDDHVEIYSKYVPKAAE